MAPKEIPDRWEPYIPIGSPVRGTRFIALKVPLKEHVCAKLQPKLRWTIDILTDSYPDIGMIVDLTLTTRYYNFLEVLNKGVDYCKVAIPGQQLPSESLVKRFFAAVDFYLDRRRDDSLIGVHCTHGVNRTGYMIARYMIQRMGFSVSDALESITVARGHPIERENYVSDLGRHLEKLPKVLDGSDVHKGRAPGEPPRMALGIKVAKKKKPMEPRMGKDTVKRHGPARSDNRDGNEGEWKNPRRNVDPWEPGCGPERPDDFMEERFNNPRNKDFRGTNMNKRPVIWENEKKFDEDRGHFVERNFPEPMEERPFNRNPRDEEMERGGGDRVPRKRFPDKRGQPSHFREERGPPMQFREERGPSSSFREERGPPPHFREEREPIAPFREDRGPQHHFRDDRGPPHPFREERGPPALFREERGPPAPFREDRGPPAPFREDRGPPAPFREERGPPAPFREDRGPPAPFREGRGPPPFREERGPPPQFREERGQPLPFREERGPPQHFRDESGPSSHFRGDRDDKRNFNRGRPDDFIGDPSRGPSEKRFDGRGHHQDEHWEDNGPPHAGPVGDRRGFHGRSGSPVKRRDDYHQQGQLSGRRTSPPARRMSPKGRRMTTPGRRMSPPPGSGRRMSPPGRPMVGPPGRPTGGPPARRMSPPGRMMSPPGRRMSPQGRRMSPPHSRRVTPPPEERMAPAPFGRMSPQSKGFPAPQPRISPPRQRRKSPPRERMSPHRQRMSPPHHQRMSPPRQRRVTPPPQRGGSPRQMGPRGSPPRQRGLEMKRGPPPALRGDMRPPFLGKPGQFERPAVEPFPHSRSPPPNLKPPVGHFDVRGRQTSPGPVRMRRSRSPVKRRSPPHNFPPAKRRGSPLQGRISPPPFKKDSRQQRSGPKDMGPFDRLGDFEQRKDPRPPGPFERDDSAHSAVHPHDSGRPRHDDRGSPVHIRKSPSRFSSRHEGAPAQRRDQRDFQEHRLGPDNFQGPVVNQREEHFFPAVPQPFIPQRSGSPILSRGGRSPPPQMISEQYPVREDSRNRQRSPNRRPLKEKEFPPRHIEGDSFQQRMGRPPFRSPARSPGRKDRVLDSSKKEQRPASRGRSREDRPRSSGRSKSSNIERGDQRPHSDMRGEGPSRRMELDGRGGDFPQVPPPPIHIERPRFNDKQGGIPRDDRYRGDDPPSNYKERDIHRGASPHLSRGIPTMKPPVDYSPRRKRSSSPGFPEINDKGWDAELEQDCRELILQKRISSVARSISGVSNSSFTQRTDAVDDVIVIDDSSDADHSRPPSRSRRRPVASRLSPKLQRRDKSRSPRSKKPVFERLDDKKPPVFERLEVAPPRRPASKGSPRKPRGVPRGRR